MTEILEHKPHVTIHPNSRQARPQLREDADAMLRDLAFVLKMTQRVRDDMEREKETEALAPA